MVNIDHIEDKHLKVNESPIPYSTNYFFCIFNYKTREFHKGGEYFRGTPRSDSAKYYKSALFAKSMVAKFVESDRDSTNFEDYAIVEHIARATGKIIKHEEDSNG